MEPKVCLVVLWFVHVNITLDHSYKFRILERFPNICNVRNFLLTLKFKHSLKVHRRFWQILPYENQKLTLSEHSVCAEKSLVKCKLPTI